MFNTEEKGCRFVMDVGRAHMIPHAGIAVLVLCAGILLVSPFSPARAGASGASIASPLLDARHLGARHLGVRQATYRSAHFTLSAPAGHDVRQLLDELERAYDDVRSYGLALPVMVRVWSYGSTSEFVRRSPGESFHLALAEGERLHLQPVAVLLKNGAFARTLRHELAHVGLANAARRGLPRWLNEGVAMVVAGESHPETMAFTSLRQLDDTLARSRSHAGIRSAYGTSVRLARLLVERHGREKVLALLRTVASKGNFERAFRAVTGATLKEWERSELGRR